MDIWHYLDTDSENIILLLANGEFTYARGSAYGRGYVAGKQKITSEIVAIAQSSPEHKDVDVKEVFKKYFGLTEESIEKIMKLTDVWEISKPKARYVKSTISIFKPEILKNNDRYVVVDLGQFITEGVVESVIVEFAGLSDSRKYGYSSDSERYCKTKLIPFLKRCGLNPYDASTRDRIGRRSYKLRLKKVTKVDIPIPAAEEAQEVEYEPKTFIEKVLSMILRKKADIIRELGFRVEDVEKALKGEKVKTVEVKEVKGEIDPRLRSVLRRL